MSTPPADTTAADRRAAAWAKRLQSAANAIHERLLAALLAKDLRTAAVEFAAGAALLAECLPATPPPPPLPLPAKPTPKPKPASPDTVEKS